MIVYTQKLKLQNKQSPPLHFPCISNFPINPFQYLSIIDKDVVHNQFKSNLLLLLLNFTLLQNKLQFSLFQYHLCCIYSVGIHWNEWNIYCIVMKKKMKYKRHFKTNTEILQIFFNCNFHTTIQQKGFMFKYLTTTSSTSQQEYLSAVVSSLLSNKILKLADSRWFTGQPRYFVLLSTPSTRSLKGSPLKWTKIQKKKSPFEGRCKL